MAARPIRSLHVSDLIDSGGAEEVFHDTVAAAQQLGHEVTTLVSDGRRTAISYVMSRRWYHRMRALLAEVQPDLVHLQNYYRFLSPSVLLAIRHHRRDHPDLRVVHTAHDYHLLSPNSGLQHFPRGRRTTFDLADPRVPLLAQFDHRSPVHSALKAGAHALAYRGLHLQREFDLVLCPSATLQGALAAGGVAVPTRLVRNPVRDPARLGSAEGSAALSPWAEGPPVDGLVYLGRVASEKGLVEFVQALEACGGGRLDIYGSGSAIPELTRLLREPLRSEVRLLPRVPRRQVAATMARYRGFVYPSVWPENAPIAVVEAIIAGLPVLVPAGGGAEEIARRSRQWVTFDPADVSSVQRGIDALQGFSGRNGLLDPEEFSFASFVARLDELYASVLPGGAGS